MLLYWAASRSKHTSSYTHRENQAYASRKSMGIELLPNVAPCLQKSKLRSWKTSIMPLLGRKTDGRDAHHTEEYILRSASIAGKIPPRCSSGGLTQAVHRSRGSRVCAWRVGCTCDKLHFVRLTWIDSSSTAQLFFATFVAKKKVCEIFKLGLLTVRFLKKVKVSQHYLQFPARMHRGVNVPTKPNVGGDGGSRSPVR